MIGPERQLAPCTEAVRQTMMHGFPIQWAHLDSVDFHFNPEGFGSNTIPPYAGGDGYYSFTFCGMYVGVELDGYAHS